MPSRDAGESGHRFVDIALKPQLARYPEIGYAAQIELKYFKATDEVTPATLAQVKADALEQLARYARDKNIAREWNLKPIPGVTEGVPGGTVELRRLLVVFHGGRVVCLEEV